MEGGDINSESDSTNEIPDVQSPKTDVEISDSINNEPLLADANVELPQVSQQSDSKSPNLEKSSSNESNSSEDSEKYEDQQFSEFLEGWLQEQNITVEEYNPEENVQDGLGLRPDPDLTIASDSVAKPAEISEDEAARGEIVLDDNLEAFSVGETQNDQNLTEIHKDESIITDSHQENTDIVKGPEQTEEYDMGTETVLHEDENDIESDDSDEGKGDSEGEESQHDDDFKQG